MFKGWIDWTVIIIFERGNCNSTHKEWGLAVQSIIFFNYPCFLCVFHTFSCVPDFIPYVPDFVSVFRIFSGIFDFFQISPLIPINVRLISVLIQFISSWFTIGGWLIPDWSERPVKGLLPTREIQILLPHRLTENAIHFVYWVK